MLLHVGRIAGASQVAFIDTTSSAVVHSSRGSGKWKDPMDGMRALPGYENQRTRRFQHEIDVPGARHGMGIPRAQRHLHSLATDV